jgi:hypothetical protein
MRCPIESASASLADLAKEKKGNYGQGDRKDVTRIAGQQDRHRVADKDQKDQVHDHSEPKGSTGHSSVIEPLKLLD